MFKIMEKWRFSTEKLRSGLLVLVSVSLPLVPLKLSPYLPYPSREMPNAIATIDAPDAEFEPVFIQTITPPVDMSGIFPTNPYEELIRQLPRLERVPCGDIDDDVCYEICTYDRCYTYGNDDDRVELYVKYVKLAEQLEGDLEILRSEQTAVIWKAAGSCVTAGAGATAAYVAVTAALTPEPTISKVIAIVSAIGAGLACVGVVYSAWQAESAKQSLVRKNIAQARRDAEFEFNSLEVSPPRGNENE